VCVCVCMCVFSPEGMCVGHVFMLSFHHMSLCVCVVIKMSTSPALSLRGVFTHTHTHTHTRTHTHTHTHTRTHARTHKWKSTAGHYSNKDQISESERMSGSG